MSDSEDLFGDASDGGDTDELVAASKRKDKPIAKKKSKAGKPKGKALGRLKKKKDAIPDADEDSDDEATGLFDSDDEGAGADKGKKVKKDKKPLSKRDRMEALRKKARAAAGLGDGAKSSSSKSGDSEGRKKGASGDADAEKEKGYDSQNSYDSGTGYARTKEDDDFIDVTGEDEDVVREYYAEQHFDDERPDDEEMEEIPRKKGRGGYGKKRARGPDALDAADQAEEDNPVIAAVNRMKKKKKVVRSFEDLKEQAEEFVSKMEYTADEDDLAIKEKRPGLKKLQMLDEAVYMMTNRDMIRPLLESGVLSSVKRWIQPLPNGSLGNVTVRKKMIDVVAKMGTGEEHGIDTDDLKRSGFGKLVMTLYMHKKETPEIKRKLKKLIEEWSRTIFGKSGNMRDLASAQSMRRNVQNQKSLAGFARSRASASAAAEARQKSKMKKEMDGDIGAVISKGVKQAKDMGRNRVSIPYSKGFQYTVRPSDVTGDVADKKTRISNVRDQRESLHKRMLEKNRPVSKNARSANISIEGRPTK